MKTPEEIKTDIEFIIGESSSSIRDNIKDTVSDIYKLGFHEGRKSTVSADSVVETNRQLLLDRSNVGIDKYGTTLTENKGDLRYWLNHALEECLDQANYLQRAIMELDAKNGNN